MNLLNTGKYLILMTAISVITLVIAPKTIAQPKPKPPASTLPNNSSNFTGKVQNYLLNREGLVDGLLLDNDIQAKFPPHLGDRLVEIAPLGSDVSIDGMSGTPTNFGQEVKAYSITNMETGENVIDQPPLTKKPLSYKEYNSLSATGSVEHWLVGRRGEINGVILSSGTQVKFPPHLGERLVFIAQDSAEIEVQGFGVENDYGRFIEASTLVVDGEPLNLLNKQLEKKRQ